MRKTFIGLLMSVWLLTAQAQPFSPLALKTPKGCALLHNTPEAFRQVYLAQIAGDYRCADGTVQGPVVYGFSGLFAGVEAEQKTVFAGVMVNGVFDGLYLGIYGNGQLRLQSAGKNVKAFAPNTKEESLQDILKIVGQLAREAGGINPVLNRSVLEPVVTEWYSSPMALTKKLTTKQDRVWVKNPNWNGLNIITGMAAAGTSAAPIAPPQDDPKTTGRGARGG